MEPVARHIAIALDNARLLEAVRRRGHEFESLLEIGRRMVERHGPGGAAAPGHPQREPRDGHRATACSCCARGDTLELAAHEGLEPEVVEAFGSLRVGESLTGLGDRSDGAPAGRRRHARGPAAEVRRHGRAATATARSWACPCGAGARDPGHAGGGDQGARGASAPRTRQLHDAPSPTRPRWPSRTRGCSRRPRATWPRGARPTGGWRSWTACAGEYLRNVSHEFRTPLTVIKGYAEFLMEDGIPRRGRPAGRDADHGGELRPRDRPGGHADGGEPHRAGRGGAGPAACRRLDLREVVGGVGGAAAAGRRSARASPLELDFPAERLALQGDRGLLQQVVRKLVDNAVKYSPPGGRRGGARARAEAGAVAAGGRGLRHRHRRRAPAAHLREVLHGGRGHRPARGGHGRGPLPGARDRAPARGRRGRAAAGPARAASSRCACPATGRPRPAAALA